MEESLPIPVTPTSAERRRLKKLTYTVVGISVLCMLGGGGYLAYKKIQDNIAKNAKSTGTATTMAKSSPASPKTSPLITSLLVRSQSTLSISSETIFAVYSHRLSKATTPTSNEHTTTVDKTTSSPTQEITPSSTKQTSTVDSATSSPNHPITPTSIEQTTTVDKATSSTIHPITPTSTKQTSTVDKATSSPIHPITPTSTKQTSTVDKATSSPIHPITPTSTKQTSTVDKATSSPSHPITPTSTEQTTTVNKATSSPSHPITPTSTEQTTTVNKATSSPTQAITPTSTEQATVASSSTQANTPTSTEQTSTVDKATSSPTQLCSTRPNATLPLDFSSIDTDLCQGELFAMCNNGSKNDNVPKYCECAADGIWTVIQKRFDGSVDFYRNWTEYKEGFGNSNCEFWLGNDIIHQMTANEEYILKIYLTDWDNVTKYAVYHKFRMEGESSGYRLEIDDYSGDAGDSMKDRHDGLKFSTKDRDNDDVSDISKAYEFHGAWWYGYLTESNLNGQYLGPDVDGENGIMWLTFNNSYTYSMKETKMLIIRKK